MTALAQIHDPPPWPGYVEARRWKLGDGVEHHSLNGERAPGERKANWRHRCVTDRGARLPTTKSPSDAVAGPTGVSPHQPCRTSGTRGSGCSEARWAGRPSCRTPREARCR